MREFFEQQKRYFVLIILLLCALSVYSYHLRNKENANLFERSVLVLTEPLTQAISSVADAAWSLWHDYIYLVEVREKNAALRHSLEQMTSLQVENTELAAENTRLKKLLDFRKSVSAEAIPAQIISADAINWFRTITINKGTNYGIHENMPVVSASGVVGRTIKCAAKSSRVLLITDASSAVAALIQRNRTRTVIRGTGVKLSCEFAPRLEEVQPGDSVVTSGNGGVFPKGLPIATITKVHTPEYGLFQTIEATPAVDFARLEEVLVILTDTQ